jgi:hypothetical protein
MTIVPRIDHVLLAVRDLDQSADRLRSEHGLGSVPGGPHPGWGTANRLVPLGDQYLELIAVVDPSSTHPFAGAVGAAAADGDHLLGVCLEVSDIVETAARLGTTVVPGSRSYPDGAEVTWRLTGVEAALGEQLPFFIQWDTGRDIRMGQSVAEHATPIVGIERVELGGDGEVLRRWLQEDVDGIATVGGPPGVRGVTIRTQTGYIRLEGG